MEEQGGNMKESAFKPITFFRNSAKNGTPFWEKVSLMNPQKPTKGKRFIMFVSTTQKPPTLHLNSSTSERYFNPLLLFPPHP